jgi:hypothetical protein
MEMVYEPKNSVGTVRKATAMMLAGAAHFRKLGNKEAARRAINTIKSWR